MFRSFSLQTRTTSETAIVEEVVETPSQSEARETFRSIEGYDHLDLELFLEGRGADFQGMRNSQRRQSIDDLVGRILDFHNLGSALMICPPKPEKLKAEKKPNLYL